jgi:hypothetical protein
VSFEQHPAGDPYMSVGPGYPPGYPPPQGSSDRRPPKFWYAIGAGLIAIGVIGGLIGFITMFAGGLSQLTAGAPTQDHTFGNRGTATMHIDAGASKTIYVTKATPHSNITCTARGTHGEQKPTLTEYRSDLTVNQWRALFTLTVQDDGDYTISCEGPSNGRYGVGEHISGGQIARPIVGPLVAAGIGSAVVIAGVVVLIVTAIRRSRSAARPPFPNKPQQWPGQR